MKKTTTKKVNTKKGMSGRKILAGLVSAAAVGAGAYYLLGPDAKKNQKKAKVLMGKVKKEMGVDAKMLKKEWDTESKKMAKKAIKILKKKVL